MSGRMTCGWRGWLAAAAATIESMIAKVAALRCDAIRVCASACVCLAA